jgi:hypothetical protein
MNDGERERQQQGGQKWPPVSLKGSTPSEAPAGSPNAANDGEVVEEVTMNRYRENAQDDSGTSRDGSSPRPAQRSSPKQDIHPSVSREVVEEHKIPETILELPEEEDGGDDAQVVGRSFLVQPLLVHKAEEPRNNSSGAK